MQHTIFILFLFALGVSIGSFLNVLVWRLPRGGWRSLVSPPSHCPRCEHPLAWYDNVPVFGWIFLRGKCRYCRAPISVRYPIVEAFTGGLFVFYYVMFFIVHIGPCAPEQLPTAVDFLGRSTFVSRHTTDIATDWPIYSLYMFLLVGLLAASLIDLELFIIPPEIPWAIAVVAMVTHAVIDHPAMPGALNTLSRGQVTMGAALGAGGGLGLLISLVLWFIGVLPTSFPEGEPAEEFDKAQWEAELADAKKKGLPTEGLKPPPVYTSGQVRGEIRKEIAFLLPPLIGAAGFYLLTLRFPAVHDWWQSVASGDRTSGLLGSILGALVGALVVWLARIFGTLAIGRVAMGLGDVHLMFGVGAVIGAGGATVAFFIAPFGGLLVGVYRLISHKRHDLPLGPHLSLATAVVMLLYSPIADYLGPGFEGLARMLGLS